MTMSDNDAEKGGFISKVIGPKRRWRAYKARSRQLPASYRTAVDALERYLNYFGGAGSDSPAIYEDLIDLFEQGAANGTPVREIVGEDPVEFVEEFVRNYPKGQWVIRERERLISAIDRAAGEDTGTEARAE
jgi:DNA-binding ferritin-like protein (Dps family)